MKSTLKELINKIENTRDSEIHSIKEKYQKQINELIGKCNHTDDNGVSTLSVAGHPFHPGWDVCGICGKYIETNKYGRAER